MPIGTPTTAVEGGSGSTQRVQFVDHLWADLTRELPASELERIRGGLDVWAGACAADLAPGQRHRFDLFVPGLPSSPWNDAGDFACTCLLEDAHDELRAEFDDALANGLPMQQFGRSPDGRPLLRDRVDRGWREIKLHWMNRPVAANCERLPRAAAVMEAVFAESKVLSLFSYLAVGARCAQRRAHRSPQRAGVLPPRPPCPAWVRAAGGG